MLTARSVDANWRVTASIHRKSSASQSGRKETYVWCRGFPMNANDYPGVMVHVFETPIRFTLSCAADRGHFSGIGGSCHE
jgi:hypothetical protein